MANGQQGASGYSAQPNTATQQTGGQAAPYNPGANYWAQKNQALNPTGQQSFGYNVNKMAPGWWNGAQNQGANGVVSQYGGPISASSLTPQDQAFMANAGRFMGGGFDPRNIVNGSADQVSQMLGGDTYKGMAAFQKNPQQALAGVSPQVLQAMSQMASQNPELQARWNQLTGGGQNPQPPMGVMTPANQGGPLPYSGTTGGNMAPQNNSGGFAQRFLGPPLQAPGNQPGYLGPPITPGNQPRYLGPPVQAPQSQVQPPWAWGGNNQLPWMQGS